MNKYLYTILLFLLMMPEIVFGQLVNIKGNAQFFLSSGAVVQVNGGLRVDNSASLVHQNGSLSYLNMSGKFELYGTYTQNSDGRITFNKGTIDTIAGANSITIARIYIDKTNNNRVVLDPNTDLTITEYLYLLNSSLELVDSDLLLNPWAKIYSSLANDTNLTTFNANKCIINSGSSIDPLLGGRVIRKFNNSLSLPQDFIFPIGTPGYYSPAKIELRSSGATFGSNPEISIKPVDREHPQVEVEDKSLTKYWVVNSTDVNINSSGANVYFYYNAGEVVGNESNYRVLYYAPSYNDPSGFWRVDPGNDNDIVDFNERFFYSTKVDSIKGDWLAGEPEVSAAIYYSRQNGDWDDPNTWSKVNFGGVASNTVPNKQSDKIRIKGHTVTIDAQPAPYRALSLEKDAVLSTLIIQGNFYLTGDSTIVQDSTYLSFAHQDGIAAVPTNSGCIRTAVRSLSSNSFYEFSGSGNQNSGTGLPNVVRSLIVNKNNTIDTVKLQKNIAISRELRINEGTFDANSFAIDGATSGRTLTMNGGELVLRSGFPSNYAAPSFSAGKVTFAGLGNTIIPSSSSTPGVIQYNKLKIAGNPRSGNITFPNNGQIRIKDSLDLSSLVFANNTFKFLTDGSTVVFNKVGGTQYIPIKPSAPADSVVFLSYFNLILDSTGTKEFVATGTPLFRVLKDITLRNNSNFNTNNFNLEVQGSWINQSGATFNPGNASVIMRSAVALITESITSRDTTANAFNNLVITGAGIVSSIDNLKVLGNVRIDTTSFFRLNNNTLSLYGNFIVNGGTHVVNTSTVQFNNNITQNIISTSGDVPFNNLEINNPQNVIATSIGNNLNGVVVSENLILRNGNLVVHSGANYRYVQVFSNVNRIGTGFVDGELRKRIPTGANTVNFEVGHKFSYTPVTIQTTGTGGTEGFLGILSDTLGVGSIPISWTDATPSDINPAGSTMNMLKHVARQIGIRIPTGSAFQLGASREYNVTVGFIPGDSPNGDIRNSADFSKFSGRLWNGSNWITPFYYGAKPVVGTLTSSTFQYSELKDFGTLIFGEPGLLTYYSLVSGVWNEPTNWSIQNYGGAPSVSFPGQLNDNYKVFIGDGKTITMNLNRTITNTTTDSAFVQIDSSGTLLTQNFVLSGNGAFRLKKNATLGIGNADGITVSGATGNIQTGTRNYNHGSHNLGHFIYNGSGPQNTGNGLPTGTDSVLTLTVNKPTGNLTINASNTVNVKDSLFIQLGSLNSGSQDIKLLGNFRINTGSAYIHNNRNFTFAGDSLIQRVTAPAANMTFYRLFIDKSKDSSNVKFMPTTAGNSYNISVDSLIFTSTNLAYIDLSPTYTVAGYPDYNQGEWFMTLNNNNPYGVNRSGLGHIEGELRKYIPSGTIASDGIVFETGASVNYRPFRLDLENTGGNGTAGYIGVQSVGYYHPESNFLSDPSFALETQRMVRNYWRLVRPAASSFSKSTQRGMDLQVGYMNPNDIPDGALIYCFDLAYWRGNSNSDWQRLSPPDNAYNNGAPATCGDRDIVNNEATYSPNSTSESTEAYNIDEAIDLANTNLNLAQNNRFLLADVVVGQQGPTTIKFYSRQNGNWTDPNTWSNDSYSGAPATTFPKERLHLAYIGDGRTVTLDANIGNSYPDTQGTDEFREQRLGSVLVEKTANGPGHLKLGTFVIRASVFTLFDGGIIETGAEDGFHSSLYRGNLISQYNTQPIVRDFNYDGHNNGNYIFKPEGVIARTFEQPELRYCNAAGLGTGDNFIARVAISNGPTFGAPIYDYYDSTNSTGGFRSFPYKVFRLTAGNQYTMRVYSSGPSNPNNYWLSFYLDSNFSGSYSNSTPTERIGGPTQFGNNNYVRDFTFTVNSSAPQGTTQMRLIMRNTSGNPDPCNPDDYDGDNGETEDYTVYIVNPNYQIIQETGASIPAQIASIKVDAATNGQHVRLNSDVSVKDSVLVSAGKFSLANQTLRIQGDLINNSGINGIDSTSGTIVFDGSTESDIRGTSKSVLYNMFGRKFNNNINVLQNLSINKLMQLDSNNKVIVDTDKFIYFNDSATVSSGSGSFSNNRMIELDANSNISNVTKEFVPPIGTPTPTYCASFLTQSQFITRVQYGTLDNNNNLRSNYTNYTALTPPTIAAGNAINFSATRNSTESNMYWRVWIDLNQNGTFEPSESLASGATNAGVDVFSQNIVIPSVGTLNGNTRLRVKISSSSVTSDSCEVSTANNGEVEDYLINITGGGGLSYCVPNLATNSQYINRVRFSGSITFNNQVDVNSGYTDYTNLTIPTITANVAARLRVYRNTSSGTRYFRVWVDLNQDGIFQSNEIISTGSTGNNTSPYDDNSFTIPTSAFNGSTRMRVKMSSSTTGIDDPCQNTTSFSGEFEDYTLTITGATNKPATPTYCTPSMANSQYISRVQFGTLDNNADLGQGYSDYTFLPAPTITAGTPTSFTGTKNLSSGTQFWRVWIDYNQDGDFADAGEAIFNTSGAGATINQNITIPLTAYNGITRMRVKLRTNDNSDPCEQSQTALGEIEDYKINIVGGVNNPTVFTNMAFIFPIGANNVYSPANFVLNGTFGLNPLISVLIKDEKHPNRMPTLTDDVLSRYWRVSSSDIIATVSDSIYFQYDETDVNGVESKYIPAKYDSGWEINLGYRPKVSDNRVRIFPASPDTLYSLNGDWTAGVPESFFNGRRFYSINNGNWNDPASWSNTGHDGFRSQYFPGDIYYQDTVMIDGHTIAFRDSVNINIDSLRIGGTNIVPGQGILNFELVPINKSLSVRQLFVDEDGLISGLIGVRQDTIIIKENFRNESTALQSFRNNLTSATNLKFIDTSNSRLFGTGNFGRLGNVILQKTDGLLDTLFIEAPNFAFASDTTLDYTLVFNSGFLSHIVNTDLFLSSGENIINMNENTGIGIFNGSIRSNATVISNFNTNFQINGGDFIIGDAPDDNFLYKTGTTFNVINGNVAIGGVFGRALGTSLIDFTMNGNNDVKVLTHGNTDDSKIGFDISNSGSSFSMNNGRIIIANAGGNTPSTADYNVSAQFGTGMIGGALQSGDSSLTPSNTTIKIAGSSPVYDLHFANNVLNNVETQITESIFTINNDWTIDANHSFDLDGNTVRLAGDLTNYGSFTAVPIGPTANPYQIELNGTANQILFSNLAPFEVYKLSINKPTGNVILDGLGNSNLIVRNALEFTSSNLAFIDASATNRFVELSPTPDSDPVIFRVGLGHIFGRLYRYIPEGNTIVEYPVGADTITSYRPARFSTIGTGGTAGLVGVRHYPSMHSDSLNAPFIVPTSVRKYWNVDDPSSFDLGTRTFDLTLQYINPQDLNGTDPQFIDMYRYSPPLPAVGTWSELSTPFKSDSSARSINNTTFGDFALGEPDGLTFYSYNSGLWSDLNTWSLDGYTTKTTPVTRQPQETTDIVRIGNGKAVTLEDNYEETLKSVIVERFNNLPGELYIRGNLNYFRGNNFVLEDSCTLGIQHINGITNASQGNSGAVQTNARNYGVSRYVYNSIIGSTVTGLGLPDSVKSIVIDMQNNVNKTVFLSNIASPTVKIQDTLFIRQGEFSTNTRFVAVNKVLELDTVINNGRLAAGTGRFIFPNPYDKYIILKNRSGVTFYDLEINDGNVIVKRPSAPIPDSSHVYVNNVMNFSGTNSKFEINDNVNLEIKNSSVNAILNFSDQNFVRIGVNGGLLIRRINPSLSYTFPIGLLNGINNEYNPVTFDGLAGTAGKLGARVDLGSGMNFAHIAASGIASSSFIQKYWSIDSTTIQIDGKLRFFYNDADVFNTESEIIKIGRWNPVREATPGNWTFPFDPNIYDHNANYFETTTNFSFNGFRGDWAFGSENYFRRLFFSRQNGNWNDENTWTYNSTHTGPIFGTGMWPNFPNDSVTIGGGINGTDNHIVVLNVDLPFTLSTNVGIAVGTGSNNTGTLDFGTNNLNGNRFILRDLSTLIIGSPDGISTVGNPTGNLRSTDARILSKNAKYHYRGNVDQISGNALPDSVNTLIADNQGIINNNTVLLNASVKISDSLIVRSGRLDIGNTNNVNASSIIAHFRVYPNAIFAMGGSLNMLLGANDYQTYNLENDSYVEFYGNNQIISDLPLALTQSFVSNTGGFGNIITTENGTKLINSELLIRNNLINRNNALLSINGPVNSVRVLGNVINSASIYNEGIIELGN